MASKAALKLRCRDGHWEWATWEIRPVAHGFVVVTPCSLGDHYLWSFRSEAQGTGVAAQPMVYPTRGEAETAIALWEQLQETPQP